MKKSFMLLFLIATFAISQKMVSQLPQYDITGKIEDAEGVKFVLQRSSAGKMVSFDSTVVAGGELKMNRGSVEYPQLVYLVAPEKKKRLAFFLENSAINISGKLDSLQNASITGSKSQDEFSAFLQLTDPLYKERTKIYNEYLAANAKNMTEIKTVQKEFIKNHPGSFVSPVILFSMLKELKPEEAESILSSFDPEVAKSPVAMEMKSKMSAIKSVAVGQKAPDFSLNDAKGKPVSLYSKLGSKLLLIDFWAGWCAPCRQENPNVLKVYNEFRKKGFDIIGVSLDRNKDEWLKAIKDDKLPWTQVSDLNYFSSTAAKLYNVSAIPANFLLDDKGVIIAVNLRGEALYNKVKGILMTGTVTDIDGNVYNTVTLGTQVWMTENLKTTKYRNGDPIPHIRDTIKWGTLTEGAFCNIQNKEEMTQRFGRFYNWYAVNDPRNLAPQGWHVPTDMDWDKLIDFLGGRQVAGGKLKEAGTTHWLTPNNGATNSTGMTFLPAGNRNVKGQFNIIGRNGFWWSSSEFSGSNASRYDIMFSWPSINRGNSNKNEGHSIRCVRDQPGQYSNY